METATDIGAKASEASMILRQRARAAEIRIPGIVNFMQLYGITRPAANILWQPLQQNSQPPTPRE